MSAVIISAVLMMIMLDQNMDSFGVRFSILNHEKKTASFSLALSCAQIASLYLKENDDYRGNETLQILDGKCEIKDIENSDDQITLQTSAMYGVLHGAYTDLNVNINPQNNLLFISENLIQ